MPLDSNELKQRLERADRVRAGLRLATRELREMGRKALDAHRREPRRPDQSPCSRLRLSAGRIRTAIAFERVRFGGLWVSRITLLAGPDASGLNTLDLVEPRSMEYARRALSRALGSTLRSQPIRLLTPEDFVVFKVLSTRELDLDDARSVLLSVGAEIDRGLIESSSRRSGAPRRTTRCSTVGGACSTGAASDFPSPPIRA
jgi:hypothetical protein